MRDGKPPDNFIPGCFSDSTATGPIINKYRAMLEPQNTPFPPVGSGLGPIKRLWKFLVHQEPVQCIFIRYIFGKSKPAGSGSSAREMVEGEGGSRVGEESVLNFAGDEKEGKMRVIHKEQDNITAFCINKVSSGLIAASTPLPGQTEQMTRLRMTFFTCKRRQLLDPDHLQHPHLHQEIHFNSRQASVVEQPPSPPVLLGPSQAPSGPGRRQSEPAMWSRGTSVMGSEDWWLILIFLSTSEVDRMELLLSGSGATTPRWPPSGRGASSPRGTGSVCVTVTVTWPCGRLPTPQPLTSLSRHTAATQLTLCSRVGAPPSWPQLGTARMGGMWLSGTLCYLPGRPVSSLTTVTMLAQLLSCTPASTSC